MFYLFPLLTVSIWAGNAIVNKLSISVIDPGAISFYRWFVAMSVLTPFVLGSVWRNWSTIRPYIPQAGFFGVTWHGAEPIAGLLCG